MSNILKETLAKAAGNVTQSVASAVIVFLITTYALVDIGKKEKSESTPSKDSLKKEMRISPIERQENAGKRGSGLSPSTSIRTNESRLPQNTEEQITPDQFARGDAAKKSVAGHEVNDVPLNIPNEKKREISLPDAQAKEDTVEKEKKPVDHIKKVKTRADDVFDELEDEVNKKPPL